MAPGYERFSLAKSPKAINGRIIDAPTSIQKAPAAADVADQPAEVHPEEPGDERSGGRKTVATMCQPVGRLVQLYRSTAFESASLAASIPFDGALELAGGCARSSDGSSRAERRRSWLDLLRRPARTAPASGPSRRRSSVGQSARGRRGSPSPFGARRPAAARDDAVVLEPRRSRPQPLPSASKHRAGHRRRAPRRARTARC